MTTLIHTPTSDLNNSLDFYTKLDFDILSKDKSIIVTDGIAIIEINPDRHARAGLKIIKSSWKKEVQKIEKITPVIEINDGYLVSDPNGVKAYLIEGEPLFEYERKDSSFGKTGNFSGVNFETTDIYRSIEFWTALGFKHIDGAPEKGFVLLISEDGLAVALMKVLTCPHLFINPSMTYFNGGKNIEVIRQIRNSDIPILEEVTYFNKEGIIDNIIIQDPGGYGFFIFND